MDLAEEFTAYVETAWSRLFRTAYALTGSVDAADDLLQASLVKVFANWRKVRRAEHPDAYVRRIVVNQATSTWRRASTRREVLTDDPWRGAAVPAASAPDHDDELWMLVLQLPERQRAVLVLRYYEDLSEREIADSLGIAPGTVKSLASAAMTKLRGALAETAPARTTSSETTRRDPRDPRDERGEQQ
ncbi:SigE family RNA polymerase sigma factor [Nocardioides sp. BGMRC 2183]|nr:SigE family RNA polymerase sigma factor [Nocardioides sp. BGMRC 2183]